MDKKSFGKRMQKYREMLGYSQEALAETVGCSSIFISYIERGEKSPSLCNKAISGKHHAARQTEGAL